MQAICRLSAKAGAQRLSDPQKREQDERIVELCTSQSGALCVQTISRKIQQHYEEQWKQYNYKDKEIIVKGLEKLNQFLDAIMRKENMR